MIVLAFTSCFFCSSPAFIDESDFWNSLKQKNTQQAEKTIGSICEHQLIDREDFIRAEIMLVALRATQGSYDICLWELNRIMENVREVGND